MKWHQFRININLSAFSIFLNSNSLGEIAVIRLNLAKFLQKQVLWRDHLNEVLTDAQNHPIL